MGSRNVIAYEYTSRRMKVRINKDKDIIMEWQSNWSSWWRRVQNLCRRIMLLNNKNGETYTCLMLHQRTFPVPWTSTSTCSQKNCIELLCFLGLGLKNRESLSSLYLRSKHCDHFMNLCSAKGTTFLRGGGGGTSRSIFFTKRSSNGRHGEGRERGREEDGRHHCTPFEKTMLWRAWQASARWAAQARSLTTIEWSEWPMVDNVERVLARFGSESLSSSSSFAVFTCAIPGLRMTRIWRDLKWGTTENQRSLPPSPSISSFSMAGHITIALRSVFSWVRLPTDLNVKQRRRTEGGRDSRVVAGRNSPCIRAEMVMDRSISGRDRARRIIRCGGSWRVVRLGSRVAPVCVKVSWVCVGVGGSGDSGGIGNRNDWLGVVGAERRRVRVGVAGSGVGGDASSSSSSMRNGKRRETTLVWPSLPRETCVPELDMAYSKGRVMT